MVIVPIARAISGEDDRPQYSHRHRCRTRAQEPFLPRNCGICTSHGCIQVSYVAIQPRAFALMNRIAIAMTFVETNSRIDQERRSKFCGTASVSVRALCFTAPEWSTQTVTYRRTVEPYKRKFREERGLRTNEHQHHVKAVIDAETLAISLREANVSVQQFREQKEPYAELELPPDTQLQCLQRYEKVLAATEAFDGARDRWTVDLYLDGR